MANRYSATNRRNVATSSLFADYPGSRPSSTPQQRSTSPYAQQNGSVNAYAYPQSNNTSLFTRSSHNSQLPTHTKSNPYTSTAVLEHLEAQNEGQQTSILSSKVSQLKQLTIAIGDGIRESSNLADTLNTQFEGASGKLKGTMKRMLRMAEKTGVGWKVWLGFFAAVWMLFVYVWLF